MKGSALTIPGRVLLATLLTAVVSAEDIVHCADARGAIIGLAADEKFCAQSDTHADTFSVRLDPCTAL